MIAYTFRKSRIFEWEIRLTFWSFYMLYLNINDLIKVWNMNCIKTTIKIVIYLHWLYHRNYCFILFPWHHQSKITCDCIPSNSIRCKSIWLVAYIRISCPQFLSIAAGLLDSVTALIVCWEIPHDSLLFQYHAILIDIKPNVQTLCLSIEIQ